MSKILSVVNAVIWGAPALLLILGVGMYFTLRLGFPQFRLLPRAIGTFGRELFSGKKQDRSSFRALCTALGATVGTGNLVGVAGAVCIGGPGAIFWMWICGVFGMITKYAEALLAVRYRVREDGEFIGGPMYVITCGMGQRFEPLAKAYCLFGVFAAFGVGNAAQVNAVVSGAADAWKVYFGWVPPILPLVVGVGLAVLMGVLLFGGARGIADAAQKLVPLAAGAYLALCIAVLVVFRHRIPDALEAIVTGAFSPKAATGGALGSAFQALRIGCSRGVFTNEAGMGTAAIAHGSAEVAHPCQQGLMGIVEVFLDTIVICTMTALVILVSGVPIPYGTDAGAALTVEAFASVFGKSAALLLTVMLSLFAVATILGWSLYGASCARFLFGKSSWNCFTLAQILGILLSAVMDTASVWQLSETINGLMVIPNLISLAVLSPEVIRLTKEYIEKTGGKTPVEVPYADFHQCKPL